MPRLDYYIRIILSFFFPLEIIISYIVLHGMFLILLFLFLFLLLQIDFLSFAFTGYIEWERLREKRARQEVGNPFFSLFDLI